MQISQNRNLGCSSFSNLRLTSKSPTISPATQPLISKYFSKSKLKDTQNLHITTSNPNCYDSPHKNAPTKPKMAPIFDNSLDDFKTPVKPNKPARKIRAKSQKKPETRKPKKPTKKQNPIFKATKDNFENLDVNPEHLQMALALSRSTFAAENPAGANVEEDLPTLPTGLEKATTLERFGFRSARPTLNPEERRNRLENIISSRPKTSRYKYISPVLQIRTDEDRKSLITSKISLILHQNSERTSDGPAENPKDDTKLSSVLLRQYIPKTNTILLRDDTKTDRHYCQSLGIEQTNYLIGCLLKKWEEIPGRDKSPDRRRNEEVVVLGSPNGEKTIEKNSGTTDSTQQEKVHVLEGNVPESFIEPRNPSVVACDSTRDCVSPDLFGSEDEFSQSLLDLSPRKSQDLPPQSKIVRKLSCEVFVNDKGIECFESFSSDPESLSRKIYDLTQSSDDEETEEIYTRSLISKADEKAGCEMFSNGADTELRSGRVSPAIPSEQNVSSKETDSVFISSEDDEFGNKADSFVDENVEDGVKMLAIDDEWGKVSAPAGNDEKCEELNSDNMEMSPLELMKSNDHPEDGSQSSTIQKLQSITLTSTPSEKDQQPCAADDEPNKRSSYGRTSSSFRMTSPGFDDSSAKMLNVTDYVNRMLNSQDLMGAYEAETMANNDNRDKLVMICEEQGDGDSINNSQKEDSFSQESILISDEELNYSSIHSREPKNAKGFYNLSDDDVAGDDNDEAMDAEDIINVHMGLKSKYSQEHAEPSLASPQIKLPMATEALPVHPFSGNKTTETSTGDVETPTKTSTTKISRKQTGKVNKNASKVTQNPSTNLDTTPNNNVIIKFMDVTPMPNYEDMNTPTLCRELGKHGLKPLKRRRGVQLLKYLYDCTHPVVYCDNIEDVSGDEDGRNAKRKKVDGNGVDEEEGAVDGDGALEIVGDELLQNENMEDLIFERKQSAKIPSCRVPLQIVWHNFVSSNPEIRENILLYEPLQLEVLRSMLKSQSGCKFHAEDILAFLDKKCITIRTAQSKGRRKHK